jgi:hypothetical protein
MSNESSHEHHSRGYEHFNPASIKVIDTTGAVFLGLLAILLLIALLRAQARNRELLARLAQHGA